MTALLRSRLALLLLTLAAVLGVTSSASAASKTKVAVGLGDQGTQMFSSSAYKALKLKKTRYFLGWDAASDPAALAKADAYVAAARKAKVKVLMHLSDPDFAKGGKLPSAKAYKSAAAKLVKRYKPKGVKEWGVWNEVNHNTQAPYRNPKRAAAYFVAFRAVCKGCTIVALDILDQAGATTFVRKFYAAVPKSQRKFAKIVGIHNYGDVNRGRSSGTASIIREVKRRDVVKSQFWLTETGGLVSFGKSFPCDEKRAAKRITSMFSLAKKFRSDVKRLYAYNWQGTNCETRFDAGLVNLDGSIRPSYTSFKKGAAKFTR